MHAKGSLEVALPPNLFRSPRVLRFLSGAVLVLVFAGPLVRFAGCRACGVPYRAVS